MDYSEEIVGQISSFPERYFVVRRSSPRGSAIYLQKEGDTPTFGVVDVYQGQALGGFVMRLVPNGTLARTTMPIDVPIITMYQYGNESLPVALETARNHYSRQDFASTEFPAEGFVADTVLNVKPTPIKEPIWWLGSKNASLWKDSIAGVLHEQSNAPYYVITRTTAELGKMQFPFLQDKYGVVWHVRAQRVKGSIG